MKFLMRKCTKCARYTLKESCPVCGAPAKNPHPPKFSPEDKYAAYRIEGSAGTEKATSAAASTEPEH